MDEQAMTDLSIFTNKNENGIKLSDRLNTVLINGEYFDVLVGYFRLTGFYLLQEKLENIKEIRILVGLGIDRDTLKTVDLFSSNQAIEQFKEIVKNEFNNTKDDSIKMENGILKLCEWISLGKVKVRMCYEKNVHAKIYIVRKDQKIVPDQYGNLITGSSNFSYNGLENNVEFNVELKNKLDIKYALDFFEDLWSTSRDISKEIVGTIKKDTWINSTITPYELFLKTIYTYFKEEISDWKDTYEWPSGYMKLQYQEHAVTQARKVLAKHGGVLISDVVGLGKTYIAAMLGKHLKGKKLFIVPPVVKENWESVLAEFDYKMSDRVVSHGILDQITEWEDLDEFEFVFVDEAHRFRNASTNEFNNLKRICFDKGVVLITATPQNNTILDIANLITLFQDSKNSSIMPDCTDLNAYFRSMYSKLKQAKKLDKSEYDFTIREVANDLRDNVLRHVLIRRTRLEIMKYYSDDLIKQNLVFPKLKDPIQMDYMYEDDMEETFNKTIELLKEFTYARFAPLLYLKNKSLIGSNKARQENVKGFIKTMLIKRLESSIYAFLKTIDRLINGFDTFIRLYEAGRVPIGAASRNHNVSDLIDIEDEEYLEYMDINEIDNYKPENFDKKLIENVRNDYKILKEIYDIWSKYDLHQHDSKYEKLKIQLDKIYKNRKLIIFSEAKDTIDYLKERLVDDYGDIVVDYSGSDNMKKKQYIKDNFDPKFEKKGINDKSILLTTDALSEGINLHLADTLINYDLPWNPTRVMQRTGRINRVGSKNNELFVYNFFPRANVKEHLSLTDSIKAKVQMFHDLLGEDAKVITNDERIDSFELYDFLTMANKLPDEEEMSSNALQMSYIQLLENMKKNNRELFERIQNLPEKIRVARKSSTKKMITFIKQGLIKKFLITDGNDTKEIDFESAMKFLEVNENEKSLELPEEYYDLLDKNKEYFINTINQSTLKKLGKGSKDSINEKKTKQYVAYLLKSLTISDSDKEYIKKVDRVIKKGTLNAKIYKDLIGSIGSSTNELEIISAFQNTIDPIYLKERENYMIVNSLKEKQTIVLSEYFVNKEK